MNIDYKILDRREKVTFQEFNGKWFPKSVNFYQDFTYKQPSKGLDIHLFMNIEFLITEILQEPAERFSQSKLWRKNQLLSNMPGAFDEAFWGKEIFIQPTEEIESVVQRLNESQRDFTYEYAKDGWEMLNPEMVSYYSKDDGSIYLRPIINGLWIEDFQGALLYRNVTGDFTIESDLRVRKINNDENLPPDKWFQLAGLMARLSISKNKYDENNVWIFLGTRGNKNLKYGSQITIAGKSKRKISKTDQPFITLRTERLGEMLNVFIQNDENWQLINSYDISRWPLTLQVGATVVTHFPTHGPSMYADLEAIFKRLTIKNQSLK